MKVTIDATAFTKSLQNYFENIDYTKALYEIGNILEFGISQQFITEGTYFGNKWKPLAPSTVKQRKRKGYYPINILRRTGLLFNSINSTVAGNQVFVGVGMNYAKYLHFGTADMPARPILPVNGLPNDTLELIADTVAKIIK